MAMPCRKHNLKVEAELVHMHAHNYFMTRVLLFIIVKCLQLLLDYDEMYIFNKACNATNPS